MPISLTCDASMTPDKNECPSVFIDQKTFLVPRTCEVKPKIPQFNSPSDQSVP